MPDHGARQAQQAVGDAADVHQIRGQQEERHREQDEGVVRVERLLHEGHGRQARLDQEDRQRGQRQREGDRDAQEQEQEEQAEQDRRRLPRRQHRAGHAALPRSTRTLVVHLLAEEDQPGRAGDRPGDVDRPERQLGQLGDAIPAEAGEPDPGPQEHDRDDQHAEPRDQLERRLGARRQARPEIDLEMACSRAPRSWRRP